jgi:hypothetical protein
MAEQQPQQLGNLGWKLSASPRLWPRLNKPLYPRCALPRPGSRGTVGQSSRKAATEFTHLHKAIRRQADHLIDHIAGAACLMACEATIPNGLRGRLTTLENDWARFSEAHLVEAEGRFQRFINQHGNRLCRDRRLLGRVVRPIGARAIAYSSRHRNTCRIDRLPERHSAWSTLATLER